MFWMENGFENVLNIESYGDIFLYFCEIGNMKKYLTLVYMASVNEYILHKMAPINGYKLDKYVLCQWV